MWMSKRTRGAVSVFLVIILVPCIVASSLFVDLGRVYLSKSMADSAGDLAMNSLLANYDSVLNDWYGMAVSCQNIETFIAESERYFVEALKSSNLSDDEIYGLIDDISHTIGTDQIEINDLLQIECQTESGNIITPVEGANLTNPTLLKEQIVEFMKYRGPIDLTESLIKKLKKDKSLNRAQEAKADQPLIEAKEDYYTTLGELIKSSFNTYWMIRNYFPLPLKQTTNGSNISNNELEGYAEQLTGYKEAYSDMYLLYVVCLMNTENLKVYKRVTAELDEYTDEYTYDNEEIYTEKKTQNGATTYYINGKRIKEILDEAETKIDEFNKEKKAFCEAVDELMMNDQLPSGNKFSIDDILKTNSPEYNHVNQIRWWVRMNKAINDGDNSHTEKLRTAADDMMKAYAKISAILDSHLHTSTTGNVPIPADWENTATGYMLDISDDLHEKYLTADAPNPGNKDPYLYAVKTLEDISKANENAIRPEDYMVKTETGVSVALESVPGHISQKMKAAADRLTKLIGYLDIAINGHTNENMPENECDRVLSLDALVVLARDVKAKLDSWSDTANGSTTDMSGEDRAEIEKLNRELSNNITGESVRVLKNRLVNIKNQLEKVLDALDSMKFCGKKLKDISSYKEFCNTMKNSGNINADDIPLKNCAIDTYARESFKSCFVPNPEPDKPVFELGNTNNPDYDPTLYPVDANLHENSGKVKTPSLYSFFHKQFKDADPKKVKDNEQEAEDAKNEANDVTEAAKGRGRFHGDVNSCILKNFSGDGEMKLFDDGFSTLVDFFQCLIDLDLTSIRDDIYVTDYIMKMFSYATHETEGLYSLCDQNVKIGLALPAIGTGYYPPEYEIHRGNKYAEGVEANKGKWLSELPRDHYNKTLTNKMINAASDTAYGAEVEYILFGKTKEAGGKTLSDNYKNVKKAYTKIFEIRLVLNLVSGFANFWSANKNVTARIIDLIARLVTLATCGIIPSAVTKIILIPILTAFETAKDLERLEAGFPVEIFKLSDDQWWTAITGENIKSIGKFVNALKSGSTKTNKDKGISYSDYLTAFVYMGIKGNSADAIYQRLAEVMQSNMIRATGNENYSMKKACMYFKLNAEIRVKPLMMALPIVRNNGYELEGTNWRTYRIKTVRGY